MEKIGREDGKEGTGMMLEEKFDRDRGIRRVHSQGLGGGGKEHRRA